MVGFAVTSPYDYGWSKGGGVLGAAYHFGWPGGGVSEPNVSGQWAGAAFGLGATSNGGSIIDRVASLAVAKVGSPVYGVTTSGSYSGLSPGITVGGGANYFSNAGDQPQLDLGTSDFTIEFWVSTT